MKNNELRLLWPFYITALITSSLSVALPIWVIFFEKRFSFVEISIALSLQSLAGILFEIPTGAIADIFGRKISVVLGVFLQGILWLVLPFIEIDIVLYSVFFLTGILRTMESGADKAWMVDWLKDNHQEELVQELFTKIHSLHSTGFVVSSLLSSLLLFALDIRFLFYLQGCGYIIESLILSFFAKEIFHGSLKTGMKARFRETVDTTKKGIHLLLTSRQLLFLVTASAFSVCSKDFGCIAWQPLLVDLSLSTKYLGVAFSLAGITGIIAPFFIKKLLKKFNGEKYYLSFTTFLEFAILASLFFVKSPFYVLGVIAYISITLISDLQSPVGSIYFQSLIPSNLRATMGSVQSMILAVFSLAASLTGGYIIDKEGPRIAVICFSFFLIPAGICYLMIRSRTDSRPNLSHEWRTALRKAQAAWRRATDRFRDQAFPPKISADGFSIPLLPRTHLIRTTVYCTWRL